jgi:adenylylsulfate kinase-like enzyme
MNSSMFIFFFSVRESMVERRDKRREHAADKQFTFAGVFTRALFEDCHHKDSSNVYIDATCNTID